MAKVKVKFTDKNGSKGVVLIHSDYAIERAEKYLQDGSWISYSIPGLSQAPEQIERSEEERSISCSCGNQEVLRVDEPKEDAQKFIFVIENSFGEGVYICSECEQEVESITQ